MINPTQLRFQPLWSNRHAFYDLACEYSCGLEIVSFALPWEIDDPILVQERLAAHKDELPSLNCPKSFHGAFIDVTPHSPDRAIREVATRRVYESMDLAAQLDCVEVIFHTGINPLIRNPAYLPKAIEDQAKFWRKALYDYPMLKIYIENMWEQDGTVFSKILEQVNDPRLGMCFDCGHANVFGNDSPEIWMKELISHIPYMHWNDNLGDYDSELVLGEGNIDWMKMASTLELFDQHPSIVLEVGQIEKVHKSLDFLTSRGFLPTVQQGEVVNFL
jgi:sugar phosphate isomerase/epimerase